MWKNRNIWILMLGEGIAGLGMWVGIIGNLEFLQQHVPSDFMKSLILLSGLFVGVLFGPMAGKVIDKHSKKTVMIYAGILRALAVFFMFAAIQQQSIAWMIVYMLGIGVSAAFYFPALQSSLPLIAKDNELLALNGLHMNVGTIARIAGTAVGGIMLVSFSLFSVYMWTFVSYVLILSCTFLLQIDESKNTSNVKTYKKGGGFTEVWPIIRHTPAVLLGLVLMLVPIGFLGSFNLMVLKISELQQNVAIKGWLYTAEGVAFMCGAFMIKKISGKTNIGFSLLISAFGISVSHLSLFFADHPIPSIISFAIFGFAAGTFFPLMATLFQRQVPKEYHGRFFSFRNMMDRLLFQAVLVSTGFFLDTIGFHYMVLVFGGFSLLLTLVMFVHQMRRPTSFEQKKAVG